MCEKESICAWCNKPATGLQLLWDEEVCESCVAQFAEETGRAAYQGRICQAIVDAGADPIELPRSEHEKLEDELLDDIARVHGRCERSVQTAPEDCYRARCEDCDNPGPGAMTIDAAEKLALAKEFVRTDTGLLCKNCAAGFKPSCDEPSACDACKAPCEDQPLRVENDTVDIWRESAHNRLRREYGLLVDQVSRAITLWSHTIKRWRDDGQDEYEVAPLMMQVMRLLGNRVEEYEKRREEDRK